MVRGGIPNGWMDYTNMGNPVAGTAFVPFKVPLKNEITRNKVNPDRWFTPDHVLKELPNLKLIINLTNVKDGRYYDFEDFEKAGVKICLIPCEGRGLLPPESVMKRFFTVVDDFVTASSGASTTNATSRPLIGVHCTHGLNRTGLFICKYMVNRMGIDARTAIRSFESARGHQIVRQTYIDSIVNNTNNTDEGQSGAHRGHGSFAQKQYRRNPVENNWRSHSSNSSSHYEYNRHRQQPQQYYNNQAYNHAQTQVYPSIGNRPWTDRSTHSNFNNYNVTPQEHQHYTNRPNYRPNYNQQNLQNRRNDDSVQKPRTHTRFE